MNRRRFIKTTAATIAALAGTVPSLERFGNWPETPIACAEDAPFDGIVVAQGTEIVSMVRKGIDALGGISRFVKPGQVVVIKPNMSWGAGPETGAVTNCYVVGAFVGLCKEAGAKEVKVIDHTIASPKICLHKTGIAREVEAAGGRAYGIETYRKVNFNGLFLKNIDFAADALDADVLVSMPVAKDCSESRVGVSIGLKGYMGLIRDRGMFHASREANIHECIADLMAVRKPDLTIIDGINVLISNGPQPGGKVKQANTIYFGTDPVALDAMACKELLERDTMEIKHITLSHRRYGTMNYQVMARTFV